MPLVWLWEELSVVVGSDDIGEERGSVWHARWDMGQNALCSPPNWYFSSPSCRSVTSPIIHLFSIGLSPHSLLPSHTGSSFSLHQKWNTCHLRHVFSSSPLSSPTSNLRAQAVSRFHLNQRLPTGLPPAPPPDLLLVLFLWRTLTKAASNTHLICENKWNMWK